MTKAGSSLVEFILVFPMMVLFVAGLFFVVLLGLRQIMMGHEAARMARAAAQTGRIPPGVVVRVREIPLETVGRPHLVPRRLEIITLELFRPVTFLRWSRIITARAKEVRVIVGETP